MNRLFVEQVAAYGNYVDLLTLRDGIAASGQKLNLAKDPFSLASLFVEALRREVLAARKAGALSIYTYVFN